MKVTGSHTVYIFCHLRVYCGFFCSTAFTTQQCTHFKQLVLWQEFIVRGLTQSLHPPSSNTAPNKHGPVTYIQQGTAAISNCKELFSFTLKNITSSKQRDIDKRGESSTINNQCIIMFILVRWKDLINYQLKIIETLINLNFKIM
jgi:hypothetical protein